MPVVVKVQVAFSVLDSTVSVQCTVMSLVGLDFRSGFGVDCGRFVPDDVVGFDARFASSVFSGSRLVWANVVPYLVHLSASWHFLAMKQLIVVKFVLHVSALWQKQ